MLVVTGGNYVPRADHCADLGVAEAQGGASEAHGDVRLTGAADIERGVGPYGRYFVTCGSWEGQIEYICTKTTHLRR